MRQSPSPFSLHPNTSSSNPNSPFCPKIPLNFPIMADNEKSERRGEFGSDSGWMIEAESENVFFFSSDDRGGGLLSEFEWNVNRNEQIEGEEIVNLDGKLLARSGCGGDVSTSNPSVSSSSSEDLTEKSTSSVAKVPIEIPGKVKKKGQKRIRQPRFAFMTKSDVDHLEDGYRWRKYGQKAVKNSPFPRGYYRCTNSKCTVKKRVERSSEDPSIVITTYEGQHCHHTIGFPRGGVISHEAVFAGQASPQTSQFYYPGLTQENPFSITQPHQVPSREPRESSLVLPEATQQLPMDDGLLGDIVSPGMRNR